MSGFLHVLLMSIAFATRTTSCPATCVVCSDDAVVCHKLSSIIGVPETTQVLMFTDGQINSVENDTFSDLSNVTLLGLSNNAITDITEHAFQNLTVLRVLLLDHNFITSSSILDSTFSQLHSLEILQLGNNAIRVIDGSWFRDMRSLRTLQLEGNLITRLESGTFQSANLESLETLDLSDNLIEHLDRGSFQALPRLRRLDLSRNSLRTAPDAFSYLSWLSALNLDHNQWNCTCELQELSTFLSSYIQAPDKVLYNGRQLICLSAANPAVQTVLQLSEANCVPPNRNITVLIETKGSISAQQYTRDVALAATFFFTGGVVLTIGVLYIIYYKLELKKALRAWRDRDREEEGRNYRGMTTQNQVLPEWTFTGDSKTQVLSITHPERETKLMHPKSEELSNQRPWVRDRAPPGIGPANPMHSFVCRHCSPAGLAVASADLRGQYQRRQGGQQSFDRQEDVSHKYVDSEDFMGENQLPLHIRHSSPSHRHTPTPYGTIPREKRETRRNFGDCYSRHNGHIQSLHTVPDYLTVRCTHCLQGYEYRPAGGKRNAVKDKYGREKLSKPKSQPRREKSFNTTSFTDVEDHGREDHKRNPGVNTPPQRSVTFNLPGANAHMIAASNKISHKVKGCKVRSSDAWKFKEKHRLHQDHSERAFKMQRHGKGDHVRRHRHRVQSNSLLKVKLNLNPFRKNRVHPKEHPNQEENMHSEYKEVEREGTVAKKSKACSKEKKIHFKNSRDTHSVSETKRKHTKLTKTEQDSHDNLSPSSLIIKQPQDYTEHKAKYSRPNTSRNIDREKAIDQMSCDIGSVEQLTLQRKHTNKERTMDTDIIESHANLPMSQGETCRESKKSQAEENSNDVHHKTAPRPKDEVGSSGAPKEDNSGNTVRGSPLVSEKTPTPSISQKISPKEVSTEDQTIYQGTKEGEDVHSGRSSENEKMHHTDKAQESMRPSPNSSVDLGQDLVETNPLPQTGSRNVETTNGEDVSAAKEPIAATVDQTGAESANTVSMESGTKPPSTSLEPHEGSTEILTNQESDSKVMATLTVGEEFKQDGVPALDSIQGNDSDRMMMMAEVLDMSQQESAGPALAHTDRTDLPPAHAEMEGVLPLTADPLPVPDPQIVPDQIATGPEATDLPLNKENLSNNNSLKPNASCPCLIQEYLPSPDGSPKRKLRLILPERQKNRPASALDKKIR